MDRSSYRASEAMDGMVASDEALVEQVSALEARVDDVVGGVDVIPRIETAQEQMAATVEAVETSNGRIDGTSEGTEAALSALDEIASAVEEIAEGIGTVASANGKQAATVEEVTSLAESVEDGAESVQEDTGPSPKPPTSKDGRSSNPRSGSANSPTTATNAERPQGCPCV
jgi:methyl-accepting chemotaxis protein